MIKSILHPGNGITFAAKGDYIKYKYSIFNSNHDYLINNVEQIIRLWYGSPIKFEIESLLSEMSLLEKCSLELKDDSYFDVQTGIKNTETLIYEIELLDISNRPL